MKILLVGGDRFIGKNLKEKFKDKHEIVAPSEEEIDFTDLKAAARFFDADSFGAVIDCGGSEGALVRFKNLQYFSVLHGIKKLLVVMTRYPLGGEELICADEKQLEKDLPSAHETADYLIARLAERDRISTVLRLFAPYGKYCDVQESKVAELIARGVTGKKTAVIDKDREFSAVCEGDVMKVVAAFLNLELPKGVYNVASDKPLTLLTAARAAKRLAAKDMREIEIELKSEKKAPCFTANTDKLTLALPKLKFTSHSSAIKSYYEHLLSHKSQARPAKKRSEQV